MSLKTFHVVFVLACTVLSAGFGVWEIRAYQETADSTSLVLGVGSFVFGGAMIVYGVWFLRKLKGVSFL